MELTKHNVTDMKIRRRKYRTFNVVKITIVSQDYKGHTDEIELTLHTNNRGKFFPIKQEKIEIVE
tara:strand:+ start:87 stop:281 length:195 start_codon:yes stop_codon:yes gene_type:complete